MLCTRSHRLWPARSHPRPCLVLPDFTDPLWAAGFGGSARAVGAGRGCGDGASAGGDLIVCAALEAPAVVAGLDDVAVVGHHPRPDCVYDDVFVRRLRAMGIRDRPTAPRSPWQNRCAERLVGSIRRDCLDHVVVFGERHLHHLLKSYQKLQQDAPIPRSVRRSDVGRAHLGWAAPSIYPSVSFRQERLLASQCRVICLVIHKLQ
jgi:hypothetical protein